MKGLLSKDSSSSSVSFTKEEPPLNALSGLEAGESGECAF